MPPAALGIGPVSRRRRDRRQMPPEVPSGMFDGLVLALLLVAFAAAAAFVFACDSLTRRGDLAGDDRA